MTLAGVKLETQGNKGALVNVIAPYMLGKRWQRHQ